MKRIRRLIIAAIVALTPLTLALPAAALGTCQIGYTGPDSNNQCTSKTSYTCTVDNNNKVDVLNDNRQTVASGTVANSSNTQVGSATSGTVTNSNGTTFTISVKNNGSTNTCVAVATVPATPETPATPVTPVTPVQPQSGGGAAVAALPHTSGDSFGPTLAIILGVLGIGAAASYLGAALYRRIKS